MFFLSSIEMHASTFMAKLGRQADMQRNSHFPRHYTAWDLNLDANGTVWPADNVNRIFRNSQYYNGSLPTSSGLSVFNKELLKQTMLKHEAEFRDQILELHRLYQRQKELMGEMKKIDLHKHHLSLETIKSNHILSPTPSNCVQMPQFTSTSLNLMHSHSPVSEAKCRIMPLHSSDGKRALACNGLTCTESSSKAPEFMESNCKKVGKKILDLELPAVFYIDSDEDGSSEVKMAPEVSDKLTNAFKKLPEDRDRVDKKLSNCGSGCNSFFPEGKFISANSLKAKVLADLNIPIKLEEDTIPELGDSQDPVSCGREALLQDLSEKSNPNFQVLSKEVIPSNQIVKDQEADLDTVLLDKHKTKTERIPSYNKAGQSRKEFSSSSQHHCAENLSVEDINDEQEAQGYPTPHGLQSVSRGVSPSTCKPIATSDVCVSYQIVPLADMVKSKSLIRSPRPAEDDLSLRKKLLSSPKLCSTTFPRANWQSDFQLESQPPCTKSISLNCNDEIDPAIDHCSHAKCNPVKSFDLNFVMPNLSCSLEIAEKPLLDSELKVVEACNSQDFKRTVGIHTNIPSILNGQRSPHASPARNQPNSSPNKDIKEKEDIVPAIKLEFYHKLDGEKQLDTAKLVAESDPCEKYPGYEVLIDLNTCFSMDKSPQIPSQSKDIDLEPPASPENKESSPPRGESDENQLEAPLPSSGQEDVDMQESLVMIASEALVSISSSEIHTCLESSNYEPFKASGNNSLHWFARLASSVVDDTGSEPGVKIYVKDHGDHEEYLSDGIDYFEAMTLNLTDDKVEASLCRSNGQNEDQSATFSLNQTKRGRTRPGRQQRKDFQSEILPSLASLSRYEVTEDLQMIGGLMEAAGARWENSSSRIAGRNGYAKGRRRSNVHASSTTETTMNTLRKQQSVDNEDIIQQRRLIDWGKITRRPRRRRCPPSNPRLILGQV